MADGKLCFEHSESLLDNSHQSADLPITAFRQLSVELGGDPEDTEATGSPGRVCEFALSLDQYTNRPLCL
jgi:hypothetical protein